MRTDGLGWTNTRKYTFIVWLRLGDLFVPLLRTEFFDHISIAELGRSFAHCKVSRNYRPDCTSITFWNDAPVHPEKVGR